MAKQSEAERIARIRLLSSELDIETSKAEERTRSVGTKAAFLVLTAGVLASKTYPNLDATHHWVAALLPVGLSLVAALCSIVALFPWQSKEVKPAAIVSKWVDTAGSTASMEDYLLEVKTQWIIFQNSRNNRRSRWLQIGFAILVVSIFATVQASVMNGI